MNHLQQLGLGCDCQTLKRSMGGMGDCSPGYYMQSGFCVPNTGILLNSVQGALAQAAGQGAAQSPTVQQAGQQAAVSSGANAIVSWVQANPMIAGAGALGVAFLLLNGLPRIGKA